MFDLMELDQAECALRELASGELRPIVRPAAPAEHPKGDISRCPFHNTTISRESLAA